MEKKFDSKAVGGYLRVIGDTSGRERERERETLPKKPPPFRH
jgi:hypothetical protein